MAGETVALNHLLLLPGDMLHVLSVVSILCCTVVTECRCRQLWTFMVAFAEVEIL